MLCSQALSSSPFTPCSSTQFGESQQSRMQCSHPSPLLTSVPAAEFVHAGHEFATSPRVLQSIYMLEWPQHAQVVSLSVQDPETNSLNRPS